jgi:tripartite-type tricarboxylate transporter receptor subunit TctC
MLSPRRWLRFACLMSIALALASPAESDAQSYPDKPVRLVLPLTAGGGTDTVARTIASKMSDATGQPFIVDNRPGAGGNIAFEAVAGARPDGHTLLFTSSGLAVNASLYRKVPYRIASFTPVTLIGKAPLLMVLHPSVPARSVTELTALAKSKPGALRYGSPTGVAGHLAVELYRQIYGLEVQHIPYKGAGQVLVDVASGQIELAVNSIAATMPLVRAGRLRALAQTGAKRSPVAPEVPTMHEAGVRGYDVTTWYMLVGPAGMPPEVVKTLHAEAVKALEQPDVQKQLGNAGVDERIGSTPAEAARFLQNEYERWAKVIRAANIVLD